ncbi:MAG: hypothetical protein ACR2IA_12535 [Pyrinomonadaceae bacterium]
MNRRYFCQIPECIKYRTVFEDAETIVGVNDDNEHRLFRKDTGKICFSEREALGSFVTVFLEKEFSEKSEVMCL